MSTLHPHLPLWPPWSHSSQVEGQRLIRALTAALTGARLLNGQEQGLWVRISRLASVPLPPSSLHLLAAICRVGRELGGPPVFQLLPLTSACTLRSWPGFRASCLKNLAWQRGPLQVFLSWSPSLLDDSPATTPAPAVTRPREEQRRGPGHPASAIAPQLCIQAPSVPTGPWLPGPSGCWELTVKGTF